MRQLIYNPAQPGVSYQTKLPTDLVGMMNDYLCKLPLSKGTIRNNTVDIKTRDSYVSFTPDLDWISAFVWYYISQANEYNFKYDIESISNGRVQYTVYNEGMHYGWHSDDSITNASSMEHPGNNTCAVALKEYNRKLSFSLQLSDESEYTGGDLQILTPRQVQATSLNIVPKQIGSMIVFDSRLNHRVTKVKSGVRKSLVGWVIGPRWR
jgi:Rps23 Pro-64 3,4-dihydroxylase Tpa1-like proline 4-hydroxylase